jgi:uncharacterized membrane protein YedE/YeeE
VSQLVYTFGTLGVLGGITLAVLASLFFVPILTSTIDLSWADSTLFQALRNIYGVFYVYETVFTATCICLFLRHIIKETSTDRKELGKMIRHDSEFSRMLLLLVLKSLCFVSHMQLWTSGSSSVTDELFYVVQCNSCNQSLIHSYTPVRS